MNLTAEEISAKIDALNLWNLIAPYNWAVKPKGSPFPYFCTVAKDAAKAVKVHFLMLEGWQTMHDFVNARADRAYGFVSSPLDLPHFELISFASGEVCLRRYDPGYIPRPLSDAQRSLVARILWEVMGVMLRMETEPRLPMRFFGEQAIFARVEGADGKWSDQPLEIPAPRPHVENVTLPKALLQRAADLPLRAADALSVDFRLLANLMTRETRPRCVYGLIGLDAAGRKLIDSRATVHPESGLRGLWEGMPVMLLRDLVRLGWVPGAIHLCSARVFRLVRPLCLELPVKLTLKDALPAIDAAVSAVAP